MASELTKSESTRLEVCESIIEKHLKNVMDFGNALQEVKENQLWRGKYQSFDDYCAKRWKFGRNYANKVIKSSEVCKELVHRVPASMPLPVEETQTRALASLPTSEAKSQVWQKAVALADGQMPTAAQVKEAAASETGTPSTSPPKKPKQHTIINPDIDSDMENPDDVRREPGDDETTVLPPEPMTAKDTASIDKKLWNLLGQFVRTCDDRARLIGSQGKGHGAVLDNTAVVQDSLKAWIRSGKP